MEKLRQLLNDYEDYKEKETGYSNYDWRLNQIDDEEEHEQWITAAFREDDSQLGVEESIAVIICKGYCFIEWLVENDKIDRDKELKENGLFRKYFYDLEYVKNYDRLVMWLSVEDEPIDFLISILK